MFKSKIYFYRSQLNTVYVIFQNISLSSQFDHIYGMSFIRIHSFVVSAFLSIYTFKKHSLLSERTSRHVNTGGFRFFLFD